jgi:uncharacterized protein YoxC
MSIEQLLYIALALAFAYMIFLIIYEYTMFRMDKRLDRIEKLLNQFMNKVDDTTE